MDFFWRGLVGNVVNHLLAVFQLVLFRPQINMNESTQFCNLIPI